MSKIKTYEELALERKRLESDLIHYKSLIVEEFNVIKQKVEPLANVVTFFSPSKNNQQNNKLLEVGTNLGIELLVRQRLLSKAGWFTKLVLPYILKRVSTKAIEKVHEIRK